VSEREVNDGKVTVRCVSRVTDDLLAQLSAILIDCVEGGASVSFLHPLTGDRAREFWRSVGAGVEAGSRALIVAEHDGEVIGTVQLALEQPENQPHRADLAKMLVHRKARRRGVGAALMRKAEEVARERGKSLLVLDTASDDAERLYERSGWQRCGTVPDYALLPRGGYCATTFFYRKLEQGR
jgi:GNAT superfamily N-acetyltransferase